MARLAPVAFAFFLFAGGGEPPPGFPLPDWFNLTLLFAALTVTGIISSILLYGMQLPRTSWWLVGFYLFLGTLMFSSLWYTPAFAYGSSKVLRFMTIGSLATIGPAFLIRSERDAFLFIGSAVAISLVFGSIVLFSHKPSVLGANHIVVGRIVGTGLIVITFLLAGQLGSSKIKMIVLLTSSFVLLLTALLVTGARGPFLATVFALPAMAAVHLLRIIPRPSVKTAGVALLASSIVVVTTSINPFDVSSRLQTRSAELTQDLGSDSPSFGGRWPLFGVATETFFDHPLFGVGIGGFGAVFTGKDQREYPHNIILEFAAELGIVGLTAFVALAAVGMLSLLRAQKQGEALRSTNLDILLGLFFFWLLASLVSGDVNDNRVLFGFVGLLYAAADFKPGLVGVGDARFVS